MRYKIDRSSFERFDEKNNVIPIKSLKTNRMLFLKSTVSDLLDRCDEWIDIEDKVRGLDDKKVTDYIDGITLLSCFDIAELEDTKDASTGYFVAGEKDYRTLSKFILSANGKGLSSNVNYGKEYYSEDAIRYRQFNNYEYNFYYKKDNDILAVINFRVTGPSDFTDIATFNSIFFKEGLTKEKSEDLFKGLATYAEKMFINDMRKIRYEIVGDRHGSITDIIESIGYIEAAVLPKEKEGKEDIYYFEKRI